MKFENRLLNSNNTVKIVFICHVDIAMAHTARNKQYYLHFHLFI